MSANLSLSGSWDDAFAGAQHVRDAHDRFVDVRPGEGGLPLHVRIWAGHQPPFVLLHGMASNCRTWEAVARELAGAGHAVVTVDQRGHGLSGKPPGGYDWATVTGDLAHLLDALGVEAPLLAGQSWGGNVALDFAHRYPGRVRGLALVDGGVIEFQSQPEATWEWVETNLRPPPLLGMRADDLRARIAAANPEWSAEGVTATLDNFELLPDGTVRPRLALDRHMQTLRALWEHRPSLLYSQVKVPVLIYPADDGHGGGFVERKRAWVQAAAQALPNARVVWFEHTAHDIHVHRPHQLAALFLRELAAGIWSPGADGGSESL